MADKTDKTDGDQQSGAISPPSSVASREANAELEHTRGGTTTRDDLLDAGVPMLPGDPNEPIGPEDALGPGPKRGDYSGRIDAGPHMISEPIPMDEREDSVRWVDRETGKPAKEGADGAYAVPNEVPVARLVDQASRTAEIGDEPGKGGVPGTSPRIDAGAGAGTAA